MMKNNYKQQTWPAWIAITLGLIAIACIAVKLDKPIMAFDLWWHMLIGKQFLATHNLIFDHSIFTWTEANPYKTYNAWISQILLYMIYESTDLVGLIAFRYIVFFFCVLLAAQYAKKVNILGHPLTWIIITLGIMFSWPMYLVKPEIFSVGSMAAMVWLFFYIRSTGEKAKYLTYAIPALLVFWINSHGAFFVSSLFFAGIIIGELLNTKFSPTQCMSPRLRFHLFIALALCFPALLINPYGYELPLNIIQTILTPEMHPEPSIIAYQPTSIFNRAPFYMLDYLIISMLIFVFLIWQKIKQKESDWVAILVFISFCTLYIQMARTTFFLSSIFIFVCLDLLAYRKESHAWPHKRAGKVLVVATSICIIGLIGWRTWDDNQEKLTQIEYKIRDRINLTNAPIDEAAYIKKNLPGKRIGNTYSEGGHLLYELWPEKKVLIDTREFPFRDWIKQHFDFLNGKNVDQHVAEHQADYWLISYGYVMPFIWFANSSDWKIAYFGPMAAIFVPANNTQHKTPIISPKIASVTEYNRKLIASLAAVQLKDLAFAKHLLHTAKINLNPSSSTRDRGFIKEYEAIIQGYEAFNKGDFQTAISVLDKQNSYILTTDKVILAREKLADQHWNNGDYFSARKLLIQAFNKKEHLVDLYNVMLADWHMRHRGAPEHANLDDGTTWHPLAKTLASKEEQLGGNFQIGVDTAKAMLNKSYDGTSGIISRFTLKPVNEQ